MKTIYKIVIFLAMFQVVVLMVNATGVFPSDGTFYSDIEQNELQEAGNDPGALFSILFTPKGSFSVLGITEIELSSVDAAAIIGIIIGVGSLVAIATHSYLPVVLAVFGIILLPMIANSMTFLSGLMRKWDSASMTYLSVVLGLGVLIIIIITILEMPVHGRSGGN